MRSTIIALFVIISSCNRTDTRGSLPGIQSIGRYDALISWTTPKPVRTILSYYPDSGAIEKIIDRNAATVHSAHLSGLMPDKVYYYKISSLPGKEFSLRTAPHTNPSFRFCVINSGKSDAGAIEFLYPDFLLFPNRELRTRFLSIERFWQLNAKVPFYTPADSFQWGNITFGKPAAAGPGQHRSTILSLVDSNPGKIFRGNWNDSSGSICIVSGGDSVHITGDSLTTVFFAASNALLIEVQGDEIRADPIGPGGTTGPSFQLRKGTLSFTRTCVLCRRLLEKKQYRASIDYYQRFIAENPDQKLHDDALFQIATTYDRYLFDFPKAIAAYRELMEKYPQCGFSNAARFRLSWIERNADYNFAPLAVFEKARLMQDSLERAKSIDSVAAMVERYKDCQVRGEALLWLGGILAESDPSRAVNFLTAYSTTAPDSKERYKACLKIADIYYTSALFKKAGRAYQELLREFPEEKTALQVKINRCRRNGEREMIFRFCAIVLLVFTVVVLCLNPRGLLLPPLWPSLIIALAFSGAITAPFLLYEAVLKSGRPFGIVLVFSALGVSYVSWLAARKLKKTGLPGYAIILANSVLSLILTFCILYMLLKSFHYLFVFERVLL